MLRQQRQRHPCACDPRNRYQSEFAGPAAGRGGHRRRGARRFVSPVIRLTRKRSDASDPSGSASRDLRRPPVIRNRPRNATEVPAQVAFAGDQHMVQALAADGANPPFEIGAAKATRVSIALRLNGWHVASPCDVGAGDQHRYSTDAVHDSGSCAIVPASQSGPPAPTRAANRDLPLRASSSGRQSYLIRVPAHTALAIFDRSIQVIDHERVDRAGLRV